MEQFGKNVKCLLIKDIFAVPSKPCDKEKHRRRKRKYCQPQNTNVGILAIISLNFFFSSFLLLFRFVAILVIACVLLLSFEHSIKIDFLYLCYACMPCIMDTIGLESCGCMNALEFCHKSSNQLIIVYTRRKIVDIKVSMAQILTKTNRAKSQQPNGFSFTR